MNTKYFIFIIMSVFFVCSCEENGNGPTANGEVTLSSEILGTNVYYVNGFSFEAEKFVPSLNSGSEVPDVIPENILEVTGDVIGMALSPGPGNSYGFYKNFESGDLSEAENFYENYLQVDIGAFSSLSDTLQAGQVYTFRTFKDNFVKFLVKEVRLIPNGSPAGYMEADIKYSIQKEGTDVFDE